MKERDRWWTLMFGYGSRGQRVREQRSQEENEVLAFFYSRRYPSILFYYIFGVTIDITIC